MIYPNSFISLYKPVSYGPYVFAKVMKSSCRSWEINMKLEGKCVQLVKPFEPIYLQDSGRESTATLTVR